MSSSWFFLLFGLLLCKRLFATEPSSTAIHGTGKTYSTLRTLLKAAENAEAGSVFKLKDGVHKDAGTYTIKASGITIKANNVGKAIIKPHHHGLQITIEGDGNTIRSVHLLPLTPTLH